MDSFFNESEVYIGHRNPNFEPIFVVNREGTKLLRAWGSKENITLIHGIRLDSEGFVWVTDMATHAVYKVSNQF